MAVGKNKRLSKGKKGKGKKAVDPFKEKEWYELKAPAVFTHRNVGKTIVSRTKGTHVASEALKGRIVEANLADLNKDEDAFYRKFKLEILDVEGRTAKTQFYGMDFTTDKVRSLVKKWQTLIDTHLDVITTDGYKLRLFCVAFTKKRQNCLRKTYYASTSQIKTIRKKIFEIMAKESACELKDLIKKFVAETIGSAIEKASEVAIFVLFWFSFTRGVFLLFWSSVLFAAYFFVIFLFTRAYMCFPYPLFTFHPGHLPPEGCVYPQGQASQGPQVRHLQVERGSRGH
jgi:small subunit ribosomal protein S3Ae